jgi:hypothetical protein
VGDERLAELIGALESDILEELDLTHSDVRERLLEALRIARLPRLRKLALSENPFLDLRRLLVAPAPPYKLCELAISNAHLRQEDVQSLGDWPGLASVEALDLSLNRLGVRGTRTLMSSTQLGALNRLDLSACDVGQGGAQALSDCSNLADLQSLWLRSNSLKRRGLERLLAGSHLQGIEVLDLSNTNLYDDAAAALAAWPGLSRVSVLELDNNHLTHAGIEVIMNSRWLGELVKLSLSGTPIGAAGIRAIAACPRMRHLHALNLRGCAPRDADADLEPLLDSEHLVNLHRLTVWSFHGSQAFRKKLEARFPKVLA